MAQPRWRRRLLVEAAYELTRASAILAVTPHRRVIRLLGVPRRPGDRGRPVPAELDPARLREAARVGRAVCEVAPRLAWRPTCLRRSLAVDRMLRRRGIDSAVHLGVDRATAPSAHAWVQVGDRVVGGGDGSALGFTTVAVFGVGDRER